MNDDVARPQHEPGLSAAQILSALPSPLLVVDEDLAVCAANPAAEQLLGASAAVLQARPLTDWVGTDSTLVDLVRQSQRKDAGISEYGLRVPFMRGGPSTLDIHVAPLPDSGGRVLILLQPCSVARQLDQQMSHRGAARSVAGLAATLAHEVKNPLSGIRGAAQLLEPMVPEEDAGLVRLICDETDRICGLVDRMEVFTDGQTLERAAVNIHHVLEHVTRLAENSFARHLTVVEQYDPSLPPVDGHRDQLVQVFLNLIKNASEAAPNRDGVITLATHYRHGLRIGLSNSRDRLQLPITVEVRDNGPGVADDILPHMFDAFVSGKARGSGLGLSLVSKIVGDHGGAIAHEREERATVFRVHLPAHNTAQPPEERA